MARYLVLAGAALLAVAAMHYFASRHVERARHLTGERLNVVLGKTAIASTLAGIAGDLRFLAEHGESRGLFDRPAGEARAQAGDLFRVFARQKRVYDQVRFIDLRGREVVRVNAAADAALVVPEAQLQDKSDRYYFRDAMALAPGEVYVSPLDLNVERGQLDLPPKPMMRVGTPVRDRQGNRAGVLMLNYRGDVLLHAFRTAVANISDHAMLLNAEGYWLSSPNRDDEWGFMLEHGRSFAAAHPEAWRRVVAEDRGSIEAHDALYTFATLNPTPAARGEGLAVANGSAARPRDGGAWKIVARMPAERLAIAPAEFLLAYAPLYAALFGLAAFAAAFLARTVVRHRLAEAQAQFGQRFREILENVSLLAIGLDREGRIVFGNDALCRLVGRPREALIGRDWLDTLIAEEHRETSRGLFRGIFFARDQLPRHECALVTAAGARRLIAWSTARLTDADGNVVGLTCIGEDITEARDAEQALRKVTRAVEQSPSSVMIADLRGAIEYVNPKFTQLTGYTLEEVRGRNPRFLKSGETSPAEYRRMWETITAGGEWRGLFHNRKKSGELYWEAACLSPIRDANGEVTHLLAVKEDITERKRLEEEVERRTREAARNQALAEVGRMASMVAHDLRNPLSSVKMTLQIFGRRPAERWDAEERELQQIALERVRYMEQILADLLAYSRPDSLEPEWIAIDRVLGSAILVAQEHIAEHGARVTNRCRAGLPTLFGDPTKLRQAFANLLENAAQATAGIGERTPEIEISTDLLLQPDGSWIRVEICDNGTGIDPGQEEKVFEPFYTTRARGTGLGLAIVRRIVELHGGSVTLRAAGRLRTCATVLLPTRVADRQLPAAALAAAPAAAVAGGDAK